VTNMEEYDNVIAAGGDRMLFALVATWPFADGTEPVPTTITQTAAEAMAKSA